MSAPLNRVVPAGLLPYTEQSTTILLPDDNTAFLNPIQQFNRDLSVAVISTWGKVWQEESQRDYELKQQRRLAEKEKKASGPRASKKGRTGDPLKSSSSSSLFPSLLPSSPPLQFVPREFVILEALSATGLRAIRYAKEIPGIKYVIANDLSPTAAEAMRRNVEFNDVGPSSEKPKPVEGAKVVEGETWEGRVRVREGDACTLMYNHRASRVDCVDLDPYGTAAPFMDAAIQATADGGLLAITCTDMAVSAGHNYPEKCFANYAGVSGRAVYSHEIALRLLLASASGIAARYGRYIVPVLSLSIDFYMRVFFRIYSSPLQVKQAFSKTGTVYICNGCESHHTQNFGRVGESSQKNGKGVNYTYKNSSGPPVGQKCEQCNSNHHLVGPLWTGPLHDPEFCEKVLKHVSENESKFGTVPRIKGMVTMAKEVSSTPPFYFDPSQISGIFRCGCPPMNEIASAILHGGYDVSRSHAASGSLKTDAPLSFVYDIFRTYIRDKAPVKLENVSKASPSYSLITKEITHEINLTLHPDLDKHISKAKLVRYQINPAVNWGPAGKAKTKKDEGDEDGVKLPKKVSFVTISFLLRPPEMSVEVG
ncbi:N2,N2-dimethylguanosine tRNA methyltransferase [Mrakia frigida]|uniref:tRNA (guanine26-N2)-dimethyltransferase n=1 Tax=Mrakia frigida TaxID=29902 RepID=UPI003FCC0717